MKLFLFIAHEKRIIARALPSERKRRTVNPTSQSFPTHSHVTLSLSKGRRRRSRRHVLSSSKDTARCEDADHLPALAGF
jgi:hypothetical protein